MRLSKEFRYRSPRPKLFNGDVSMPLSTNQSPSCNWKRQRLVRSEDSRLNYRRNTIYWKLSLGHSRGYILDISPKKENMLTICKEKLGVANWGWRVGGLLLCSLQRYRYVRPVPCNDLKCISRSCFHVKM